MFNARDVQAAGGVTVSYSAATSTGMVDPRWIPLVTATLHTLQSRMSIPSRMVEVFNAVIDVKAERMAFVADETEEPVVTTDTSSLTVAQDSATFGDYIRDYVRRCRYSLVRQLRVDHRR